MKTLVLVLAGSVLVASAGAAAVAAVPVTGAGVTAASGPAASAPAEAGAIRGSLETFMKAVFAGDEKGVLELAYFADAGGKAQGEAFLNLVMGEKMFDRALAAQFKDFKMDDTAVPESQVTALKEAKITVTGDGARVEMGSDMLILVRDKGVWKLDLVKTIDTMGASTKRDIAESGPESKVRAQMIADVQAGKFKTAEEAQAEMTKRLAAVEGAAAPLDAKTVATIAAISNLKMALDTFEIETGRYPTTAEGLTALVLRPANVDAQHWSHKYIDEVPTDGWGRPFGYVGPADVKGDLDFDIISAGPDGKVGTADDINVTTRMPAPKPAAGAPADAKVRATMAMISNLKTALDVFEIDVGRYPTTAEGLTALVVRPATLDAQHWTHKYIDEVPVDGWGHAFIYTMPGTEGRDFDVSSAGPDGKAGTADDLRVGN